MNRESLLLIEFLVGFSIGLILSVLTGSFILKKFQNKLKSTSIFSRESFKNLISPKTDQIMTRQYSTGNINNQCKSRLWVYLFNERVYDPQTFSLSLTKVCLIEIYQHFLFIYRPIEPASHKSTDEQLDNDCEFDEAEIYSLTKSIVGLAPIQLVRSGYWSKRFPIVLRDVSLLAKVPCIDRQRPNFNSANMNISQDQLQTLIFFARTRRAKEDCFYLFTQSIMFELWRKKIFDENQRITNSNQPEKVFFKCLC